MSKLLSFTPRTIPLRPMPGGPFRLGVSGAPRVHTKNAPSSTPKSHTKDGYDDGSLAPVPLALRLTPPTRFKTLAEAASAMALPLSLELTGLEQKVPTRAIEELGTLPLRRPQMMGASDPPGDHRAQVGSLTASEGGSGSAVIVDEDLTRDLPPISLGTTITIGRVTYVVTSRIESDPTSDVYSLLATNAIKGPKI